MPKIFAILLLLITASAFASVAEASNTHNGVAATSGRNIAEAGAGRNELANPQSSIMEGVSNLSIIPSGFGKNLGAYDPGGSLASTEMLRYDHYFVSWDIATQWSAGVDQHQALAQDLSKSSRNGRTPVVTLEPWSAPALNAGSLLEDIVAGKYDANIDWACSDFSTFKGGVIVRWGHEMEHITGRYPWATSDAKAYISAYQYVVSKCRAIAPNTSYMWSPTGNRELAAYWPGAAYVDYVGVSVYDYPAWEMSYYGRNRSFHENFGERYNYVSRFGKPVFIAEFGATGHTQESWLTDALMDMTNFPLLQQAMFFNAKDPVGWGSLPAPDWRIDPGLLVSPY